MPTILKVANIHFEAAGTKRIDYLNDDVLRISFGETVLSGGIKVNGTANITSTLITNSIELGNASDTTLARSSAGNVTIEGNVIYRAGGTDVPVTDGGTGASDAGTARTNLGLAIGTNVQAYNAGLAAIANLAVTDGNFIVGNGTTWVAESGATARTSLNLGNVDNTSDANKPVSTATQTALNAKANISDLAAKADLASPTFTGTPAAPTAGAGTNTTQIATTAFVQTALSGVGGVPAGSVMPYAGTSEPSGWLFARGQAVSRTTYAALFAAIGTTYGAGDGSTTFALPDLRGRVVAGKDDMGGSSANRLTNQSGGLDGDVLGATGGAETHTLTTAQLASHLHSYVYHNNASSPNPSTALYQSDVNALGSPTFNTNSTGSGNAHNNVQPTIILNYIIKT